jgi:hypothetical protein
MAPASNTRRRQPSIPKELRKEITLQVRLITRRYRDLFKADRELKSRVLSLVRTLLPPRPRRRGRPGNPTVTRAILMYGRLRRRFPEEKPRAIWKRIYPIVIPMYADMSEMEHRTAREQLRERVSWRRRKRRKIPAEIAV